MAAAACRRWLCVRACVCRVKRLTWGTMLYGLAREMPDVSRRAISCERERQGEEGAHASERGRVARPLHTARARPLAPLSRERVCAPSARFLRTSFFEQCLRSIKYSSFLRPITRRMTTSGLSIGMRPSVLSSTISTKAERTWEPAPSWRRSLRSSARRVRLDVSSTNWIAARRGDARAVHLSAGSC